MLTKRFSAQSLLFLDSGNFSVSDSAITVCSSMIRKKKSIIFQRRTKKNSLLSIPKHMNTTILYIKQEVCICMNVC